LLSLLVLLLLLSDVSSVVLLLLKMLLPAKGAINFIIKIKFQKSSPPAGRLPHFSQ